MNSQAVGMGTLKVASYTEYLTISLFASVKNDIIVKKHVTQVREAHQNCTMPVHGEKTHLKPIKKIFCGGRPRLLRSKDNHSSSLISGSIRYFSKRLHDVIRTTEDYQSPQSYEDQTKIADFFQ
jgi:hypothetical protein